MLKAFILFLAISSTLFGKIIEVSHFEEIKEYAQPDTLLILDIDNTLITTAQEVGSDQWFSHRRKWYFEQQGCDQQEALERALAEWEAVQNVTKVKPVEPQIPEIVKQLQEHFVVMGLTTRGLGLATRTIYQLLDIDIDLSSSAMTAEDIPLLNPRAILFRQGVLFTSGTHKGKALLKLFNQLDFYPKRIVFINDKSNNLREVEVACEERGIPFLGLRYGFLDAKVKAFRADIANMQFNYFKKILSDHEAKQLVER